jgi:hypothetical protein
VDVTYLLVFVSTFFADLVWARYIAAAAAAEKRAHAASAWSAAIIALSAFNIVQYSLNWMNVFPALVGAYLGTWVALRKCKDS